MEKHQLKNLPFFVLHSMCHFRLIILNALIIDKNRYKKYHTMKKSICEARSLMTAKWNTKKKKKEGKSSEENCLKRDFDIHNRRR